MSTKFHPVAEAQLLDIWDYSEARWGIEQADAYTGELICFANDLETQRLLWKRVPEDSLSGVYCLRHRHHVLFFRELPNGEIGIIAVLHEQMDLPSRLRDMLNGDIAF